MPADVYVCRGFLDQATRRRVQRAMDHGESEPAEVVAGDIERQDEVRRTLIIEVEPPVLEDIERRLDEQRETVAAFFGLTLTGREGPGFLRYGPGGFYGPHRDRADLPSWPGAASRQVTVVVFLNSIDFNGGELRVGDAVIAPEAGTLVAFPAEVLHEVTIVVRGTRDTIVDWFLS